uniref:Response regulator receiver domain-containing protein n=1 Tax=Candidatus Kentrum sp. FM TaxID=2126340 RepID=A0A450VMY2_9GAMM|nr:MAG: Response regulator receiver domain-containing protein [Candidatus Kentron sp. FM]VFJ44263.1 MAG: Response regulator receiver domain-containing protein [Candidatus Kentron sp. FM]VFK06154.1 MAG: Response regulator receiver domain-containing protein [Candidatus Kentron sp. FM]
MPDGAVVGARQRPCRYPNTIFRTTITGVHTMKYLFVDDQPNYLRVHKDTLREAGHEVEIARDLDVAWKRIEEERKAASPFDLVLIDLGLDRKILEFEQEDEELRKKAFAARSGQALGLRLWRRRRELQQRYCYVTNNPWILGELEGEDPELGAKASKELNDTLVLDKSKLGPENVEEKFQRAYRIWEDEQWLR